MPHIVTNTQEGKVRVKMLPPTVTQKNGNDFQIIFAHHIFLSSNTGFVPKAPQITSLEVSKKAYLNVRLKCRVGVSPSNCIDNSLQWYFNNSSVKLKSGEKYVIQERKTNTKCKKDFILTIVNATDADKGEYKCRYVCNFGYSWSSTIQLEVFPGTDNPVISKGLTAQKPEGGGGCYLGRFLLGTFRWPLRAPTPL